MTVVILIEANIVVYVEKNQIQYRPHRNRGRDSLSQFTVYVASTRKSCRAWASNAYPLVTSAGSDYLSSLFCHCYTTKSKFYMRYDMPFISVTIIILSVCCLIVIKKTGFYKSLALT
jgi:hypothetical protein